MCVVRSQHYTEFTNYCCRLLISSEFCFKACALGVHHDVMNEWATDQSAIRMWPCINILIFLHNLFNWPILARHTIVYVVPVKEIYFMAPADDQPTANYFYYVTPNMTRAPSAGSDDHERDVVGVPMSRVRQLIVTESAPASVRCVAAGGYPAPRLRVLVGDRDVTEHFRRKSTRTLRGVVGMRVIDIRSELYSSGWSVKAEDDEATVRCTAFVDRRLGEQFAAVALYVRRTYVGHTTVHIVSLSSSVSK